MNERVLTFAKEEHTYVFRYLPGCEDELVDHIMQLAEDDNCSLDWLDAATLGFQITQYAASVCAEGSTPTSQASS